MRNLPFLMVAATVVALVFVIQRFRLPEQDRHVTVGCVMAGPKTDGGWNESHYNGLLNACQEFSVKSGRGAGKETDGQQSSRLSVNRLLLRERVPEEEDALMAAVDSLVRDGCNVVFLPSFGYGRYIDVAAKKYPRVAFFGISGRGEEKNSTSYFARLYQVRYLAGIVAGYTSRTGVLGYVAAMPNPQSVRGINAYALGMRLANPKAKLLVRFTGSWDNETAERESVALLQAEGADVITYHTDRPCAVQEADARGLFSTGYGAVRGEYSPRFLTAALYDWDILYRKVLDDYLSGRTNFSRRYWLGLMENAVKLHPLSPAVGNKAAAVMEWKKGQMMVDWDVFSGQILDNEGVLRCGHGEQISDEELFLRMNWFVEGVEIYE